MKRVKKDGALIDSAVTLIAIPTEYGGADPPIKEGDRCIEVESGDGLLSVALIGGGTGTFDIRGDRALFKAVVDRAYWTEAVEEEHEADDLVPEGTAYNAGTMYLYPTWDWIRWPAPEGS